MLAILNRRRELTASTLDSGELPSGYTRLNYLQGKYGSDTTYIRIPNLNIRNANEYYFDAEFLDNALNNGCFTESSTIMGFQGHINRAEVFWGLEKSVDTSIQGRFTVNINSTGKYVNGNYIGSTASQIIDRTINFLLFAYQPVYCGALKIYSFWVKDNNGDFLYNLVPCLDNNNVPCMYDTVGKQTYYNAGTGEFLYG